MKLENEIQAKQIIFMVVMGMIISWFSDLLAIAFILGGAALSGFTHLVVKEEKKRRKKKQW